MSNTSGLIAAAVPAVVVGGGLNALGVLRSLAAAGVPVIVLAENAELPAMRSRYGKKTLYDAGASCGLVNTLTAIGQSLLPLRAVLLLTEEEKVVEVSAARARLSEFFELRLPSADVLARFLNKDSFHALALEADAPVPKECRLQVTGDLGKLDSLELPWVIKPAFRDRAYSALFKRAYRVDDRAVGSALIRDMLSVLPNIVVQEWVPGDDSAIYFCLQYRPGGRHAPVSFVGRKLRSWPLEVGGTASCIAAPEAHVLIEMTSRLFERHDVIGFASMEYKRRSDTHQYVMIEPTVGRTDHQEEVATLNGMNLPLSGYRSALGLADASLREPNRARPVYIWRDRDAERKATQLGTAIEIPAATDARVVDALWRWRDPGPAAGWLAKRIRTRVARLVAHR